ncbi:phage tail protein [Sphingomonas faeni]|uniref:phage tail protein n=1 Tax=Sphingomonas faeni TaxID=185950 RepID=UPI0033640192
MSEPFVGEIKAFGFPFAPRNYALCNGQMMPVSQNQALFSLLGTQFGGNGQNVFALPNLQGRAPTGATGTLPQGAVLGQESVTLNVNEIPSHTHALNGTSTVADRRPARGNTFANDTSPVTQFYAPAGNPVALAAQSLSPTGGNQAHANMQPFLVVNYCIALTGVFPSRN